MNYKCDNIFYIKITVWCSNVTSPCLFDFCCIFSKMCNFILKYLLRLAFVLFVSLIWNQLMLWRKVLFHLKSCKKEILWDRTFIYRCGNTYRYIYKTAENHIIVKWFQFTFYIMFNMNSKLPCWYYIYKNDIWNDFYLQIPAILSIGMKWEWTPSTVVYSSSILTHFTHQKLQIT